MKRLNAALTDAWAKIQEYCKDQYAGVSSRDVQVRWKHNTFGWTEFGVTPDGTPYIVHGHHAQSSRDSTADWYFHPEHKTSDGASFMRYDRMEEVVRDWPQVKATLEKRFAQERNIFDFNV